MGNFGWAAWRALVLPFLCSGDDWLLQDLRAEDLEPDEAGWCQDQLPSECLADFHVGRFDGSQHHRAAQQTLKAGEIKHQQPKLSCT